MKKDNLMLGLFLVLGGLALVVNKLGYFGSVNTFSIVIAIFLVIIMIKSLIKKSFAGVLFPLAFIVILFDTYLGLTALTPWTVLLAATLGSIGLRLIFPKKNKFKARITWDKEKDFDANVGEDVNNIKISSTFGETIKYINTDKFQSASLKSTFGSLRVYFDNAKLDNGHGVVNLDVSFAGAELYIPKEWTVDLQANASFGAIEEKNKNIGTGENVLTIIGSVSFAGVDITYI